jgi:trimethylamine:corrinoid methyltransferase-like protein
MLAESQAPPIDEAVDESLQAYMTKRKASFPDANY